MDTPSGPVSRSTLAISNVEAFDNGNYICEASSGLSLPSVSANFTLCVIGKCPIFYNATCMLIDNQDCNYYSSGVGHHCTSQSPDKSI
jgi:hypothetical protein